MEAIVGTPILCSILVFFSWSHSNIGDIGITPGILRLLEENIPGVEVTICANTLGLAAGTPTLHPRFAEAGRKAWMMRDLGLEEWLFDLDKDPADQVTAALMEIHGDYDGALGKVKKAMDFVERRQKETMAVVKQTALQAKKE